MKNAFWKIIDTGLDQAQKNMQWDAALLERADREERPILHLYEWQTPSATYGHFIDPGGYLDLTRASQKRLSLAQRPTGGGIIFHLWDMAFSVLVPAHLPEYSLNTLDNYAFVNEAVLAAVSDFLQGKREDLSLTPEDGSALDASCGHFCMAKPTKYDVMLQGKKVAGAAQRKTKKGFLHQGSISLVLPERDYLEAVLLPHTSVAESMQRISCPLLRTGASPREIQEAKAVLKVLLATHLNRASLKYRS